MTYRRFTLLLSLATASLVHGLLYLAAPHIYLLRANSAMRTIEERFTVRLLDEVIVPVAQKTLPELDSDAPRPASVSDLLARRREVVDLNPEGAPVDTTDALSRKLGESESVREYDLARDETVLKTIDARIIEIASDVAREKVEVARRYVRPSGAHVVAEDEFPTLRGADDGTARGDALTFSSPGAPGAGPESHDGANGDALIEPPRERPEIEAGVFDEETPEPGLPTLAIEDLLARMPVELEIRDERSFEFLDDLVTIGVDTYVDPATGEGFFRLAISPRDDEAIDVLPKEVTFVIDASKSIIQRKLDLTVRGLNRCIQSLHPRDRFNIVIFRDNATFFRPQLIQATEAGKREALEFLDGLEARGATDVYGAMRDVILRPRRQGVSDFLLVISDGRPTSGALAGRALINRLTEENIYRRTIYTFSSGKSADRYLLDLLSYRNKGDTFISRRMDTIPVDLPRFFARSNEPVLVDLKADYGRIAKEHVYPRELPDFYRGRVVTVYGRFNPRLDSTAVMRLQGRSPTARKELVFTADLSSKPGGDVSIARDWALQKSYFLIGEISRVGETPRLIGELNQLSRVYGVKTSYAR